MVPLPLLLVASSPPPQRLQTHSYFTHSPYKWVPESILGFLDALFHLQLITILQSVYCDYDHFTAERTEAQKD